MKTEQRDTAPAVGEASGYQNLEEAKNSAPLKLPEGERSRRHHDFILRLLELRRNELLLL